MLNQNKTERLMNFKLTRIKSSSMKRLHFGCVIICIFSLHTTLAQTNFYPLSGPVAFGVMSPPAPSNWNLQLHGINDYCIDAPAGDYLTGTMCLGITSRLGFTNSITGTTITDGMQLRMSNLDFTMENLENKELTLKTNGVNFKLSGVTNRAWMGGLPSNAPKFGLLNLETLDNGMFIKLKSADHYGITIQPNQDKDAAYQVLNSAGTELNFVVKGSGEVFARKYTTTLNPIPDYVFLPTYNLMSFGDLRMYIRINQHLPNIPSASEYEQNGVDLGELNRLLLEKVEELTLYILELEERVTSIENEGN